MFWIFIACQNMFACNETDTRIPSVHNPARFIEENNPFAIYYSGIESVFVDVENGTWSLGLGHAADNPLSGEKTAKWVADSVLTAPAMLDALTMYYCKADWTIDDESACIDRATHRNHSTDFYLSFHYYDGEHALGIREIYFEDGCAQLGE